MILTIYDNHIYNQVLTDYQSFNRSSSAGCIWKGPQQSMSKICLKDVQILDDLTYMVEDLIDKTIITTNNSKLVASQRVRKFYSF